MNRSAAGDRAAPRNEGKRFSFYANACLCLSSSVQSYGQLHILSYAHLLSNGMCKLDVIDMSLKSCLAAFEGLRRTVTSHPVYLVTIVGTDLSIFVQERGGASGTDGSCQGICGS